jgi:hypothetical protein
MSEKKKYPRRMLSSMTPREVADIWAEADMYYRLDADGCLVWCGATNGRGVPKYRSMSARRLAWIAAHEKFPPGDAPITVKCGNVSCVHPDHLRVTDKSTVATKSVTASTRIKRAAAARKAMIASGRTVITCFEQAQELRRQHAAGAGINELMAQFGLSRSSVHSILKFHRWQHGGSASPWAGLLAA